MYTHKYTYACTHPHKKQAQTLNHPNLPHTTHTHTRTHAYTHTLACTYTHTHTHTTTHMHTHAHTHAGTHTPDRQGRAQRTQRLRELLPVQCISCRVEGLSGCHGHQQGRSRCRASQAHSASQLPGQYWNGNGNDEVKRELKCTHSG